MANILLWCLPAYGGCGWYSRIADKAGLNSLSQTKNHATLKLHTSKGVTMYRVMPFLFVLLLIGCVQQNENPKKLLQYVAEASQAKDIDLLSTLVDFNKLNKNIYQHALKVQEDLGGEQSSAMVLIAKQQAKFLASPEGLIAIFSNVDVKTMSDSILSESIDQKGNFVVNYKSTKDETFNIVFEKTASQWKLVDMVSSQI